MHVHDYNLQETVSFLLKIDFSYETMLNFLGRGVHSYRGAELIHLGCVIRKV